MTAWPANPVIYEINTAVWLHELGTTLGEVPTEAWDSVALPGVDAIWLMGVWQRSPVGAGIAAADDGLQASFREALPDVTRDDNIGSPYCVRGYVVDDALGGPEGLAKARAALAERGVLLLLDHVPNHVAPDHPWTTAHPERFIQGSADDLASGDYIDIDGNVIALGRDPYFAPWRDVVQLNAFDPGLRQATIDTLVDIGDQCDGVRCDMAMLLLNDVFASTWGDRTGPRPDTEFWREVIPAVKQVHPDMLFVAEAYWDLESVVHEHGFDQWYDKRLYDRIEHEDAGSLRAHLSADPDYQRGAVRFLENHDEPRAAATLPPAKLRASAVAVATLPGATLWHEGQFEGWRVRLPVFLGRRPSEHVDGDLRTFYVRLVAGVATRRTGHWAMCGFTGWPDNHSWQQLLAWTWHDEHRRTLVVVNYADREAAGRVRVDWPDLAGSVWRLEDVLSGEVFSRSGDEIDADGLFVQLPPWGHHVLAWSPG